MLLKSNAPKNSLPQFPFMVFLCMAMLMMQVKAYALDPNSTAPIEIESDSATLDDSQGTSVYQGNVIISQGETRLEADTISVKAQNRKIMTITASGTPAHFVQKVAEQEATHGYAKTITYTANNAILTFREEAKLSQKNNSFSGELIEYDIAKRAIKAKGNEEKGQRVKIQYHPNAATPSNDE